MSPHKVIIIGASGHSKVIIDIFEKNINYEILCLIDPAKLPGTTILGYTIYNSESIIYDLLTEHPDAYFFIAIGDNWIRHSAYKNLVSVFPNVKFATAIHPSAQIGKEVTIGEGSAIMANAVVNSSTIIGRFCILNTISSVDHDNKIDDFSSLAPNAVTGGNVTIGSFSAIGMSATIKHGVSIGNHSVIGSSSLLMNNCPDQEVWYGSPAKFIRSRSSGERYL